ncbi:MAG: sterol desaturase family protein [Bacteroidetes bacterium]|nr:sterol desaturase family protein [Bacteroidota bacterium]MBX7046285.1 sterol desaturase family protein [Ignavibacteria bacterium]
MRSKGKFVSNRDETVRLFKNPVLEYFSHIHPITPVVVYLPVAAYCLYLSYAAINPVNTAMFFVLGVIIWTIFEYSFHRWAFHYHPKSDTGKRIHFLVHGIHHDYPRDRTRLVMPLLVSAPLAILFYFIYQWSFGVYGFAVFGGFIIGYIAYDSIHFATHHMPMKGKIGKYLKEYHLRHHYNDEHTAYGVSNPLWDYVFSTVPPHIKEESRENSN